MGAAAERAAAAAESHTGNPPSGLLAAAGVAVVAFNLRMATSSVPPVVPDLPIGQAGRSLLVTIPVLCFGAAAWAGPWVRSRLGEERGLGVTLVALVIGMAARAAWPAALFPGTVLACLAIALMNVFVPGLVRRRFTRHLGGMTAVYTVALSLGAGLAAGLTIPVRAATGGSLGWALGVWTVPAALAVALWLPQLRAGRPPTRTPGPFFGLLRSRLAWEVTLFFGCQSFVYYACLSWLPTIYRDRGVDPSTAGILLGVLNAVGILGNVAAPLVAGRLSDQRAVVAVSVVLTEGALLGVLLAPPSWALLWVTVLGVGASGSFSLAMLFLAVRAHDGASAARLSSMALGFGYLISACAPP